MPYDQRSFSELIGGYITPCMGFLLIVTVAIGVGLVSLFVLHSLFIWLSTDPERAFHNARVLTGIFRQGWDGTSFLWNTGMEQLEGFATLSNRFSKHLIEPSINIALEVLSQIAFQKHYEGVITDSPSSVPFRGHYCAYPIRDGDKVVGYDVDTMDMQSLKFCTYGDVETWAAELDASTESDPTNMLRNGSTLMLSTQHVRKLATKFSLPEKSEFNEAENMFPRVPLGPIIGALQAFSGIQALLWTNAMDITMHIAYTVLSEMAVALFNLAQIIIKAVISFVQVIIRSGILQMLIRLGLDLLITLVAYVLLPLLIAFMDMVFCLLGFAQPSTWDAQLLCVQNSCFQESGAIGGEIFTVFTSIPIVSHAVVRAVEALINPKTGRKYGESATGTTETPDIPLFGIHETTASATCAACFSCRIPELRALWLLVAMTCKPSELSTRDHSHQALYIHTLSSCTHCSCLHQMAASRTKPPSPAASRPSASTAGPGTNWPAALATACPSS